jgi:hypothetical protein
MVLRVAVLASILCNGKPDEEAMRCFSCRLTFGLVKTDPGAVASLATSLYEAPVLSLSNRTNGLYGCLLFFKLSMELIKGVMVCCSRVGRRDWPWLLVSVIHELGKERSETLEL